MRRGCLSEVALAWMHAGLGTPPQSAHVARCERCTARYRRLIRDLELITGLLMDTAIAHTLRVRPRRWSPGRGLALTGAVAAMLALVLTVGGPWWRGSTSLPDARPAAPAPAPAATAAPAASIGVAGVAIPTDPDALVGESAPNADECASDDQDIVAVGCPDDGGGDTGAVLDIG